MYVDDQTYRRGDKVYRRILLRESYRQGRQVKNRTIANISNCSAGEIDAIKLALRMKDDINALKAIGDATFENSKSVGAVSVLYQVAQQLGIAKALGTSEEAKGVLWLVLARLLGAKSRLAAVRHANTHAACETIGLAPFNEDDLYKALNWACDNQPKIEARLFRHKKEKEKNVAAQNVYLYDLTSTYFEGVENDLAAFGYNRDGKRGKMQIVYGLLTDGDGDPVSVEAFSGNTKDNATLENQLVKLKQRFGCKYVTIVGDKGMIKSGQIEEIAKAGFNYVTSITKPQIASLITRGVLQLDLFDVDIFEAEDKQAGVRYIVRRNANRVKEIRKNRSKKIANVEKKIGQANAYLTDHPKAKVATQLKNLEATLSRLKTVKYARIEQVGVRELKLVIDEAALEAVAKLDGCYAIKTDLPKAAASAQEVHDRYKDLALVEWAFRDEKSELNVRPVFLRRENRTRGHLFVTMLAYKIERRLREAWRQLDLTVAEGLSQLRNLTAVKLKIGDEVVIRIPKPDWFCRRLIKPLNVAMPDVLPYIECKVHTRRKLTARRKPK